jgi:hypothetical protein
MPYQTGLRQIIQGIQRARNLRHRIIQIAAQPDESNVFHQSIGNSA